MKIKVRFSSPITVEVGADQLRCKAIARRTAVLAAINGAGTLDQARDALDAAGLLDHRSRRRKPVTRSEPVFFRATPDLLAAIDQAAAGAGMDRAGWVRNVVESATQHTTA